MPANSRRAPLLDLVVLHPAFALTGLFHAIGGALLPSLATAVHLSDTRSGGLFFLYFAGTSIGALLCTRRYVRLMSLGFALAALTSLALCLTNAFLLQPLFLVLGISVGVPMSAVSIYAGARFGEQSAAPLTFLNFSWSIGALLAPLFAAEVLAHHSYRYAYALLAVLAAFAFVATALLLREAQAVSVAERQTASRRRIHWIALFALLTFLEVGVENTTATWLATFALRSSGQGAAHAAASSALYWGGFLASRGLSSAALLRVQPRKLLSSALAVAIVTAIVLVSFNASSLRNGSMILLGAALGPIFPLLLSLFFAEVPEASESRWVLAFCGFGGSVVPWMVGFISSQFHSLRLALCLVPAALALILGTLAFTGMRSRSPSPGPQNS